MNGHDIIVTVVVPTYRRPLQLRNCLEALAAQTFPEPWEVVVVDDGSPQPFTASDMPAADRCALRVIRQENAGPATARNRGVRECRGEFVAFTDDDCRPEPGWLGTLVSAVRERPGALFGGTTFNGLTDELFASTSQLIVDLVYEHFNAVPDHAYFLASNNIICTRERFLSVGGFDESYPRAGGEDRDLCDRWRMLDWPIVWQQAARVEHRHSQSLRTFLDLHFRYGRGAHRYQSIRRKRKSGTMHEDLSFHTTLPRRAARHLIDRGGLASGIGIAAALIAWQLANAAGFAFEALAGRARV